MTTGKYTRVGSVKGTLTIGGAEKKMEEDSSFTYVPSHFVAGPLSEVDAWLKEHHPEDASKALLNSYCLKNLKKAGVRKAFQAELDGWQQLKDEKTRERQEERQINLLILVELLKRYQDQRKASLGTDGEKRSTRKTLREKLTEVVSSGKVMDVTNAQEKGKGITRIVVKNNSIKCRISQNTSDPLYNVVYNPRVESAAQGVRHFLTEYGGFSDVQIDTIVSAVSAGDKVDVKRTITPVHNDRPSSPLTKRFTSPLRRNQDSSVDDLLEGLG